MRPRVTIPLPTGIWNQCQTFWSRDCWWREVGESNSRRISPPTLFKTAVLNQALPHLYFYDSLICKYPTVNHNCYKQTSDFLIDCRCSLRLYGPKLTALVYLAILVQFHNKRNDIQSISHPIFDSWCDVMSRIRWVCYKYFFISFFQRWLKTRFPFVPRSTTFCCHVLLP